jgi:hypothetical protein
MTGNDEDFEAQVRLALGEHAADAPRVDLADAALAKAGGIRRRRAALTAAAALVTVAVAVPVGAQLLADSEPRDQTASTPTTETGPVVIPATVQVEIAGLEAGDAPSVPYIDHDAFVDASGADHPVAPAKGSFVADAAALEGGDLVFEQSQTTAVVTYAAVGGSTDLPQAISVTPPAIDQGTKAAVFALHDAGPSGDPAKSDTIVYAKALSGASTTVDTGMHVRQVMGAYNGQVVFNATDGKKNEVVGVVVMAGPGGAVTTPYPSLKTVTAVSPQEALLAGIPAHALKGQRHCATMLDPTADDTLWTSCSWIPVEFSPDGSRVLALDAGTEGLGPNHLAVLDAQTGSVVAEYTTDGAFGRATFDASSDAIVTVLVDGRQAALVRCPTDGSDCELATPPARVGQGDPDALTQPYQLTAN